MIFSQRLSTKLIHRSNKYLYALAVGTAGQKAPHHVTTWGFCL
jgi:hypothetical protein